MYWLPEFPEEPLKLTIAEYELHSCATTGAAPFSVIAPLTCTGRKSSCTSESGPLTASAERTSALTPSGRWNIPSHKG